ncbi:MAG: amino acid ABC transporter permease [Actinobacteria bacterium]|nr:amino acid ABC transporter permease [Actinomycetota bacterium]
MENLQKLIRYYFNYSVMKDALPFLLKGAVLTIKFSVIAEFFGVIFGLILAIMKISKIKVFKYPSIAYIEFFRGTPLLMQIMFAYYALPYIGINLSGFFAGLLALSLNSAAYIAEIFRAGIESIERGQIEASRSLGMNFFQTMWYIVLPQAFRRVTPPLTNDFIILLKDSSLLSVIAVVELLRAAKEIATWKVNPSTYTAAAFIYLLITLPLSQLVHYLERRYKIID